MIGARPLGRRAAHAARPSRPLPLPRVQLRRPRLRTVLALALLLVLLIAGWFWFRGSSLVRVRTVEVTGISGPQATSVREALDEAGRSMTTLHVRESALHTAVAPYSIVKDIRVSTDFPHTLRIHVVTNVAVAAVSLDGRRIPVTSDGTLLRDTPAAADLPSVPLRAAPAGEELTEPAALAAVAALAAAPDSLRSRIASVASTKTAGLVMQLANGPAIWLGDESELNAKWAAAAAVLADPGSAGATYIDVAAPDRPAVGGLPGGAPSTSASDIPSLSDGTTPVTGASTDSADATADPGAETVP